MSNWRVKKGNTSIQDIEVRDRNNNLITDLADCTEIKFQVKERKTNSVKISKTKASGIAVNTPTTAFLRITLSPTDTNIDDKRYVMALELIWSATVKYEARLYIDNKETYEFLVEQDTIQ